MAIQRSGDPIEPLVRDAGPMELRRSTRSAPVATGTLACPSCDAPVHPARALSPAEPLACPFCGHAGPVRGFLSLASPARPARVYVRLRSPGPPS